MLGDRPGEQAVRQFLLRRRALGDDLQIIAADATIVARLDEIAAGDRLQGEAGSRRVGKIAGEAVSEVLLLREASASLLVGVGGDDDLRRALGNSLRPE